MAELEHVVKTFSLLETAEKEQPFLTRSRNRICTVLLFIRSLWKR